MKRKSAALTAQRPAAVQFDATDEGFAEIPLEEFDAEADTEGETESEAQPQPVAASAGADPLAQAESMATELQVGASAQPPNGGDDLVALADMREAMASMSDSIDSLSARLERQSALLVKAFEALQTMQRNLQRIEGEPVVTQKVPRTNAAGLEDLPTPAQYSQPKPNALALGARPTHVTQRQPDGTPNGKPAQANDDPVAATIRRKQELARAAKMSTGAVGG